MSSQFTESGWVFDFDASQWPAVLKWDDDATYRGAQQRLTGRTRREVKGCGRAGCRWPSGRSQRLVSESTRAVDFAAVGPGGVPFLIEVKHLEGTGPFEGVEERAFKIAAKVRDSLCGIAFAKAGPGDVPDAALKDVRKRLKSSPRIHVIVVFEAPLLPADRGPLQSVALRTQLKKQLGWLRGKVLVMDSSGQVSGLTISAS